MGRGISVEDIVRIISIPNVRVSSKGYVAYVTRVPDLDKNRYVTEIRIQGPDGFSANLTGNDNTPRWSPSGSKLAFLSRRGADEKEKGAGVFVYSIGGEPRKVAWFKMGVVDLDWLNETTVLALSPVATDDFDPDGDYVMTDRLPLWFDSVGLVAGRVTQIFSIDVDSNRVRKLTEESNPVRGFAPCPDGRIVYWVVDDWRKPYISTLKILERSGETVEVVKGVSVWGALCGGEDIFVLAHKQPIGIASHHRVWRVLERDLECVSCGVDRNIHVLAGLYDGNPVAVYSDRGRSVVAMFKGDGGEHRDLIARDQIIFDAHLENGRLVYSASSPTSPPEVYEYRFSDGGVRKVSRVNEWVSGEIDLVEPKHIRFSHGGLELDGWIMLPKSEGPYPMILYIHGGPKGMYGYGFYPEFQLMVANGFAVAYMNPTGSDGYSEEFADIRGRYGEVDYEQIMAFVDKVVEEYGINPSKMGVTGISYGGYMTNVIVTKTDRFSAAVSENGIADWIADFWASDIGYWFNPDQIGGTPLDNMDEYIRKSPVYHARNVKTPILFIHSLEDYRCFIDQSLAMHTALRMLGKESKLLVFTKGSHGHSIMAAPKHRMKRLNIKLKWFKDKLGITEGKDSNNKQ